MNLDAFKPLPVTGFGGQIDYQGPTRVHAGSAIKARNCAFNRRRVRQRDGLVDTAFRQAINGSPITGYDVLEVLGATNPGLYLIAFTAAGLLYIEQPSGSGCFVPLATPFGLPANARMQTASAYNCLYMAFTDGVHGLCPPLRYNGLTQLVEPVSQNPIGSRWTIGRFAQIGDLVQDVNQFWWRCTQPGFMGDEPVWPGQIGYFDDTLAAPHWAPATTESDAGGLDGVTKWEEWTPAFPNLLPPPVVAGAVGVATVGGGTLPAGQDLYVRLAYVSNETAEGPWSDPIVMVNTPAGGGGCSVSINFRPAGWPTATGGPSTPRWLAQLNLRDDAFFPLALNVYAATVPTGDPAPTVYYQQQADASLGEVITISVDPSTGTVVAVGRPTNVTSPDPGFPNTNAFANPTFGNDGSASTAAVGEGQSFLHIGRGDDEGITIVTSSSAIWSGFTAPPSSPSQIYLFIVYGVRCGGNAPANQVTTTIEHSLDNGTTWVTDVVITSNGQGQTPFKLAIPGGQDYTKIKVRAQVIASDPSVQGGLTMRLSIYDIRVGVNAPIGQILLRKTASGIDLTGPAVFTGETGLRYAIIIRQDDTDSLSPVDPVSPIAVLFTNGEAQRVAILPPGAASSSKTILALAVAGAQPAGPFFDITATDPANPASSQIVKIVRDGNGNVNLTVKNALGFQAGQLVFAYGIGSGLDGSFILATVDPINNTLSWAQDGGIVTVNNTGNVTVEQNNLITSADAVDSFFSLNFDDNFLSNSRDDTVLLSYIPAPKASDVSFLPTLAKMCYVDDDGKFYFSQTTDPGNISGAGGTLLVETSAGGRGVACREMTHGQIVAFKTNGGYQLNTSDVTPANWNPARLWELHGPPCAALIAVGQDFLVFGCKGGAYVYGISTEAMWISQEIQSDDEDQENTGSWNGIDWSAELGFWCAINEVAKEVHFGISTDGSGFPNEVLRVFYGGGWDFPEARTRTGMLITPDTARRWSRDPIATRYGRYIKRTLVTPVACAGDGYRITAHSWAAGVATITFGDAEGMPPVGAGDQLQVNATIIGSGNPATLTETVSATDSVAKTISFLSDVNPWTGGLHGAITPVSGALLTLVEDHHSEKGMATRQMTYALAGPAKLKSYVIVSLTRAAQVVTCIVQAGQVVGDEVEAGQLIGNTAEILLDGAGSFDGDFTTVSATDNGDGTWTVIWPQEDVDETTQQGTLSTTVACVRLTAFQPGRRDDNGRGIDQQYQPCYATDGKGSIMRFGGLRAMVKGAGKLLFRFVTEDPDIDLPEQDVDLKDGQVLTQFTRAASDGDALGTQFAAPLFSNGGEPGNGFELVQVAVYANPWRPGSDT